MIYVPLKFRISFGQHFRYKSHRTDKYVSIFSNFSITPILIWRNVLLLMYWNFPQILGTVYESRAFSLLFNLSFPISKRFCNLSLYVAMWKLICGLLYIETIASESVYCILKCSQGESWILKLEFIKLRVINSIFKCFILRTFLSFSLYYTL